MKPLPLLGAIIAGIVGAGVWAAVAHYANMEVGYIAWGIGLLVGYVAHALGGEGTATGVACAVIALASMLGGKALAHQFSIEVALKDEILPEAYEYTQVDSKVFAAVQSEDQIPQFMIDQEYSDAETVDQIAQAEIDDFNEFNAGPLREFAKTQPSYDEWLASDHGAMLSDNVRSSFPVVEGVKDSLGFIDLIFGFLGISTAFKLAMNEQRDEHVPTTDSYGPEYGDGDEQP